MIKRFDEIEDSMENILDELEKNTFQNNTLLLEDYIEVNEEDIEIYKRITNSIEKHILYNKKNNPLAYIFENFKKYILENFKFKSNFEENYEDLIKEIKKFIKIFCESLFIFYELEKHKRFNSGLVNYLTKDQIYNFILSIFFDDQNIYNLVFSCQKKVDFTIEQSIQRNRNIYKNLNNVNSQQLIEKFNLKKCSVYLSAMEYNKSPIHKLKTIVNSINIIFKDNPEIMLKPYDLMNLLVYVTSHSSLDDLLSHCHFIENFIPESFFFSIHGSLVKTLKSGIMYFSKFNPRNSFENNSDETNNITTTNNASNA